MDAYINYNLGDDLFMTVLFQRYPNHFFYFRGNKKYKQAFRKHKNVLVIVNPLWKRIINALLYIIFLKLMKIESIRDYYLGRNISVEKYDALVKIGGSIFIDEDGNHFKKNSKMINSFLEKNKPVFILGCNFEKTYEESFYLAYKELFSTAQADLLDVSFRDEYSYGLFSNSKNVRYSPDIIFGYENDELKSENENVYIGFSIIDLSGRELLVEYRTAYEKKIRELIIDCISNNERVALFSFCSSEGDYNSINNILEDIPDDYKAYIQTFNYSTNINDFLKAYLKCKVIIATRFHAMILGWIYQKKVIPIIYSEKMKNVIVDTKFKGKYFYIKDILDMSYVDIIDAYQFPDLVHIKSQAENHFLKLDYFLK